MNHTSGSKRLFIGVLALLFITITACGSKKGDAQNFTNIDAAHTTQDEYSKFLQAYRNEKLTNDTILFGFRIGMTPTQLENHLKALTLQGRIVNQNHKLYGLIPTNEYCRDDKDGLHHFVTELIFHLDQQNQRLTSIYAPLYAPRFYIRPLHQRKYENKKDLTNNPLYKQYREAIGDSAYDASKLNLNKLETDVRKISTLMYPLLLDNYGTKYGAEAKMALDNGATTHIWIDKGRLIRLKLSNDCLVIANKFREATMPMFTSDFSRLIFIGEMEYSSVEDALKHEQLVDKAAILFQSQMDSLIKKQKQDEQRRDRDRANKSGI